MACCAGAPGRRPGGGTDGAPVRHDHRAAERRPNPTLLAIIDTGVSPTHPDLQNQVQGFDFINNDADASDDEGHGTFVAGQAAAITNNGQGIASPAWEGVTILPIKVLDNTG